MEKIGFRLEVIWFVNKKSTYKTMEQTAQIILSIILWTRFSLK
jgi:hypothetical protein